jgi:hypothetical protein
MRLHAVLITFLTLPGILIALGVGSALTPSGQWQWMICLAVVPAVLQIIGSAYCVKQHASCSLAVGQ